MSQSKLSLKQASLLKAMKEAQGEKLVRARGGYWYIQHSPKERQYFSYTWVPKQHWNIKTVRSLESLGFLVQDPDSNEPESLRPRLLK